MNMNFIKLEDGKECILLDEFQYNENKYVILVNSLNKDDYIVRKVVGNDLVGLEDEKEFKSVILGYVSLMIKEK